MAQERVDPFTLSRVIEPLTFCYSFEECKDIDGPLRVPSNADSIAAPAARAAALPPLVTAYTALCLSTGTYLYSLYPPFECKGVLHDRCVPTTKRKHFEITF